MQANGWQTKGGWTAYRKNIGNTPFSADYYCVSKPKFRKDRGKPARKEGLKSQTFIVNQKHKKTLAAINKLREFFFVLISVELLHAYLHCL